ncbi:MAG: hypothetical protein GY765_41180, partial [bacterium]|nr:hypothetical protein [bacterium]
RKDGWENDYLYLHLSGKDKETYFIASAGRDGIFKGWEQKGEYETKSPEDYSQDIIYSNGRFIYCIKLK